LAGDAALAVVVFFFVMIFNSFLCRVSGDFNRTSPPTAETISPFLFGFCNYRYL
jgi:hypothetical protein